MTTKLQFLLSLKNKKINQTTLLKKTKTKKQQQKTEQHLNLRKHITRKGNAQ